MSGRRERESWSGRIFVTKLENKYEILTWIIAGISKVIGMKEYLSKFDIIALQETWLEKERENECLKSWIEIAHG